MKQMLKHDFMAEILTVNKDCFKFRSFFSHLDESRYEESALVAIIKLLPVVLNKLPCSFPALFTASCHSPDYRHSVLRTDVFLPGQRP